MQNAPEKTLIAPPSPKFLFKSGGHQQLAQNLTASNSDSHHDHLCYVFEKESNKGEFFPDSESTSRKDDIRIEDLCESPKAVIHQNSREILALDIESSSRSANQFSLNQSKTDVVRNSKSCVFKSLPNLNTSSEHLFV